jgi:hypothetical protein
MNNYIFKLKSSAIEDTSYIVKFHSSPLSQDFIKNALNLQKDPKALFGIVKSFEIIGAGLDVENVITQERILNIQKFDLKISLDKSSNDKYKIELLDEVDNAVFGNEIMVFWQNLVSVVKPLSEITSKIDKDIRDYFTVLSLPQRGNINHNIELVYNGDLDFDKPHFTVDVHRIEIVDLLTNIKFDGEMVYNYKPFKIPDLEIKLNGKTEFTQKWYDLTKKYMEQYNPNFLSFGSASNGISSLLNIFDAINNFFVTKAGSGNGAFVPKLYELGKIDIHTDVIINSKDNKNFVATAKKVNIESDLYSAYLKGSYEENNDAEKYSLNLKLDNYESLLNDILNYVKRVGENKSKVFFLDGGQFSINPRINQAIIQFVREVSDEPNSTSPDISLTMNKSFNESYPAVGKYNSAEFHSKWTQFKTMLIVNEVSKNIQKFLPKQGQQIQQAIQGNLEQLGGLLSGLTKQN